MLIMLLPSIESLSLLVHICSSGTFKDPSIIIHGVNINNNNNNNNTAFVEPIIQFKKVLMHLNIKKKKKKEKKIEPYKVH